MRILLIEDDSDFSYALKIQLVNHGFETDICTNGNDGLFYLQQQTYHLILLDWKMPVLNGIDFLQIIRDKGISTPVIFLTGMGDLAQKIEGLNRGADDYLVKPFAFEELLARIHCILRRPQIIKTGSPSVGDLFLDTDKQVLCCNGKTVSITARESALLLFFMSHANQTFSREALLANVWNGSADVESRNVDNFIYLLRNHLKTLNSLVQLKTVRGAGYRLEVEEVSE